MGRCSVRGVRQVVRGHGGAWWGGAGQRGSGGHYHGSSFCLKPWQENKKRPVCCCRTEEQGTGRNTTAGGRGSVASGVLPPFTVGQLPSLGQPLRAPLPPFRSAPVCSSAHGLSHLGRWSSAAVNKNQKAALSLMLYSKICAVISEVLHFCLLKPWPDLT